MDVGQRKAAGELDLGVKMVAGLEPVFIVPAASAKDEDLEQADQREKFVNAFYRESERTARQGLLRGMGWHGFQRGRVAARVVARVDRLEKKASRSGDRTQRGGEQGA